MSRWHEEVVTPPLKWFVPSGEVQSETPSGFRVRVRGDVDGTVATEYLCPVHGRFTAHPPRRAVPDEMPCPAAEQRDGERPSSCGLTAPWSPSSVATWKSAGETSS